MHGMNIKPLFQDVSVAVTTTISGSSIYKLKHSVIQNCVPYYAPAFTPICHLSADAERGERSSTAVVQHRVKSHYRGR
jgi:hypothetical protein